MSNPQSAPTLPERKKSKTPLFIAIGAVAVVGIGAAIVVPQLIGGGDGATTAAGDELRTYKIGVADSSAEYWPVLEDLLEEEGIALDLVNFSEYSLPNPATTEGEVDLNLFQHLDFLAEYNNNTGEDLQPIAGTLVVPLPIYSEQYDSVEEIPDGAEIAVPNDDSNLGRALGVLEAADLIVLTTEEGQTPVLEDVDEAASRVTVTPVSAEQTAASLSSVAAAVVNNNFALDANLDTDSALFSLDPADAGSAPYINAFVTRAEDVDNEDFATIARLYHDPSVTDLVVADSGGTAVIVDQTGEQLRESLATIQENKLAAQG